MSLARKVLYRVAAIVMAIVIIGVFLPSTVHIFRETSIDAPAATVFALTSDLHRMQEWSPWASHAVAAEFSGSQRGVGSSVRFTTATGEWRRHTVLATDAFDRVVVEIELEGSPPFRSTFTLETIEGHTRVAWSCDADFGLDLLERYARPIFRNRIAGAYESGLIELKSMAESLPRADFGHLEIKHMVVEPETIAYVTKSSMPGADAVSEAMGEAFFDVLRFIDRHGLRESGAPQSISRNFSGSRLVFDAAVPVEGIPGNTSDLENGVRLGESYGGPVIRVAHTGPYGSLADTHEKVAAYLAAYGIERNGDAWESYASDPARTPESELLTYVYYPVTRHQVAPPESH